MLWSNFISEAASENDSHRSGHLEAAQQSVKDIVMPLCDSEINLTLLHSNLVCNTAHNTANLQPLLFHW